jgi:transposase
LPKSHVRNIILHGRSRWPAKNRTDGSLPAARALKTNRVTDLVASVEGRLELPLLPAYAPDLNPDEFVWSHMKTNGVSKKPLKKNESLKDRIEEDLMKIRGNPAIGSVILLCGICPLC